MFRRLVGIMVFAAAGLTSVAAAQETDFRAVANPYQEGFSYQIGDDLAPGVDIDGLRWTLARIATKANRQIEADQEIPFSVDIEFENRREDGVKVLVVLLLEDEQGNPLERIQFAPFRAGSGRFKAVQVKHRIPGDRLIATRGLYLFCEIQE